MLSNGVKKKVTWTEDTYDPPITRLCTCQCCWGCQTNNKCHTFGSLFCKECDEWRCNTCYNNTLHCCRYCLRDWKPPPTSSKT